MSRHDTIPTSGPAATATPSGRAACLPPQAFLRRQTRYRSAHDVPGGGLLYLLATGLVVAPRRRSGAGWRCRVLNDARAWSMVASATDVETAVPVPDPSAPLAGVDEVTYLTGRQARMRGQWPSPLVHQAARIIAETSLSPGRGSPTSALPRCVTFSSGCACYVRGGCVECWPNLSTTGLLVCVRAGDREHGGRYRLSLPTIAGASPATGGRR